jgi:RNA polymerase sigma factor (sigma-70 family)
MRLELADADFGFGQAKNGDAGSSLTTSAAYVAGGANETARLYEKYSRQLYRYCLARLRSPEEAEDAVQNTFIRVHGALAQGTKPRFEAAWLYKIAHNVCLTRIEVRSRRAEHEVYADLDELDPAAPEAESDALIGLEAALASMPKNLRDAILLREWQGLSYAEIAESLDTSVSAVETLIFRARRHLASALQPAGVGLLDVGTLYGAVRILLARLRGALGSVGPAKVAAGVAAATLGVAGVTTLVTDVEAHPPAHDPAPASSPVAAVPASNATTSHVSSTPSAAPKRTAATHRSTSTPAAAVEQAHVTTAATVVAGSTTPTRTTTQAVTPSVTTPTSNTPAVTTPTVPAVQLPTVQTPTVPVPTVPVPTVSAPTVAVPTVSTPSVTVPALPVTVVAPTVTLP